MQPYFLFLCLQFCTTSLVSVSLSHQEVFHSVSLVVQWHLNKLKINSESVVWLSRVKRNLIWCETNSNAKCCMHACDRETHVQGYERAEEVIKKNFPHAKAQKSSIRTSGDVLYENGWTLFDLSLCLHWCCSDPQTHASLHT